MTLLDSTSSSRPVLQRPKMNWFRNFLMPIGVSSVLLASFGGEVCPYIEAQGQVVTLAIALIAYAMIAMIRQPLYDYLVDSVVINQRSRRIFYVELGLHLLAGVLIHLFNATIWGYPFGSLIQLTLGTVTLGFFGGLSRSLYEERRILDYLVETGARIEIRTGFKSLARKFTLTVFWAAIIVTVDLIVVITIDLKWVVENGMEGLGEAERVVTTEILLVAAVIFFLGMNLALGWIKTLRHFLDAEIRVLGEVGKGNLDLEVPVASQDEIGQIAEYTNRMIHDLRERRQIKEVLGKIVCPGIAKEILEGGLSLGGDQREVAVLFSDIRGFTARSDDEEPVNIVSDLNTYFTRMVEIVQSHRGSVDKFIGDGMMVVFGLDNSKSAAEDAVAAGREMLKVLPELESELSQPISIGIGIHYGSVVAGNIGSPNRLEFTVIGDAVNMAARLETLCEKAEVSLLFSDAIKERIPTTGNWIEKGKWEVKGKRDPLQVWTVEEAMDS